MAKTILIELKAEDKASAKIKKVEKSVSSLGQKAGKSMKPAKKSVQDIQQTLNRMGNRFRFMTIAFGAMAMGAIGLVKGFINSAREMEAATLRVGVFAVSTGQSMEGAQEAALNLARTGLVSITEASNTLANLLATGLNLDTAEILMRKMLDTAVLSKESLTDTFGRALEKSSLGIRILQERQVDAIGINFRADQVWRAYGKTIGKNTAEMSTQEKQMAIVNHLMKETERFAGGAELAMNTFGGTLSRLTTTMEIMKAKIGATLIPLIGTLADLISTVSRWIGRMAEKHAILTSVMISGAAIMVTIIAALAAIGAIIPLVTTGFGALSGAIGLMAKTSIALLAKYLLIAAAIGGLIFLVLKATGQWNKWTDSMRNLAQRIKDTINPFKKQGDAASDASEKVRKQVEKLEKQMFITSRGFKESMAEWVKNHDESTKQINKQINDLQKDYKKAVDKINSDFSRSMEDNSISHARKTEDLKRELEEEISKGIWADQTRIRDLELRLKRENEDYAKQSKELNQDKDDSLKEETSRYSERLLKLKDELKEEVTIYQKHAQLINEARSWPILDEIEKMDRAQKERIADLKEQIAETKKASEIQIDEYDKIGDSINGVSNALGGLSEKTNEPINKIQALEQAFAEANNKAEILNTTGGIVAQTMKGIPTVVSNVFSDMTSKWETFFDKITNADYDPSKSEHYELDTLLIEDMGGAINDAWKSTKIFMKDAFKSFTSYQEGGIVPGATNQEVPILAHGGETVLPAGVAPITININNPTVRQDSDIKKIADSVQEILSRRQYLRHFK